MNDNKRKPWTKDEVILAINLYCKTLFGRIVESLIEGQISEGDLVAAQKAPEAGERTADREILGHVIRKGMDEAWKPYLFLYLDGLFNELDALDMPEDVA